MQLITISNNFHSWKL